MSELVGQTFGRLTILALAEPRIDRRGKREHMVIGRCACGTEKEFYRNNILRGLSTSCGCRGRERSAAAHRALRVAAPSYSAAHSRTRADRGSATLHQCLCGEQAHHWAYDHCDPDELMSTGWHTSPYSGDPAYYVPLCRRCHIEFDNLMRGVRAA